jgi:protein phosphatase
MLEAYGQTDVGRRRKLNEDSFLVAPQMNLFAVCDGMGGHNAGEVASKMAIEALQSFVEKSEKEKEITWPYGLDVDLSFEGNRLQTAIKLANKRVYKAADNREEYTGMGTTVVAALVTGKAMTIGSAGDSRCYLVRDGQLSQLTTDDSWVSAAWAEGILSAEEIEKHPLRNVITKAIGAKDSLDISIVEHELEPGDVTLLCSDGLHSMLSDEQILAHLNPFPESLEEATAKLINAANEAGGKDNVSVILLRYTG